MAQQLGPMEIVCDAPPYEIVRACEAIGIESPADVRWCRLSDRHLEANALSNWSAWPLAAWQAVTGQTRRPCACRQHLPPLMRNTFEFADGHERTFLMAQCPRCRTIYWDEVREARRIC